MALFMVLHFIFKMVVVCAIGSNCHYGAFKQTCTGRSMEVE